ncbi:MAG TPA: PIN domain-containing protein [Bryobacterales bacterium]|nr:PIN domain-containing protein [Bryobacterales bacterium]
MLNLDTPVFLYALSGDVTVRERRLLGANQWSLSAIVLWELAKLSQLGRIDFDLDSPELSLALSKVHIWPLDLAVCREIRTLDFKSDPADEIIAATSIVHRVPLLTRDRTIRASKRTPLA